MSACKNAEHVDCAGPTGTFRPFRCQSCKALVYLDTCWQSNVTIDGQKWARARVPVRTPICPLCADQEALFA